MKLTRKQIEAVAINEQAELAVVSHMMQLPGDIDQLSTIIRGEDFHDPTLRRLFELLQGMFSAGELLHGRDNAGIIATRLKSSGLLAEMGTQTFGKLLEIPPSYLKYHALEVQKRANIRRLLMSLENTHAAIAGGGDPTEAVKDFTATLEAIESRQSSDVRNVYQLMREELDNLQDWRPPDIMTGLMKVDGVFGGWVPGELVTVCARTSGGKSAFALQVAQHNGLRGRPVLYLSLEMRENEKVRRLWRQGAGLAGVKFGRQELTHDQLQAAHAETERNACNNLHIAYMSTPTWRQIEIKVRQFRAQHGLSMVVVDYIGLIHPSDPRKQTRETVSEITAGMKRLAGELQCVVMGVVQLNREGMREDKVQLHYLADSSSVERDSDIVLGINKTNEVDNGERDIVILKNRSGERYLLKGFEFDGSRMTFQERVFYEFT